MSENFKVIDYRQESNFLTKINLDKKALYPGNKLTGTLELIPQTESPTIIFSHPTREVSIVFTLTQFEQYEYQGLEDGKITQKSNSNTEVICKREIFFIFKDESDLKQSLTQKSNIVIPFSVLLPGTENKKFFPSFEFYQKNFFVFIRHLISVEIKDFDTKGSIGLIICKLPSYEFILHSKKNKNNHIENKEKIRIAGVKGKEDFGYKIELDKNSYLLTDDVKMKIIIDKSNLKETVIKNISVRFYKFIAIKGKMPMKNEEERKIDLTQEINFDKDDIKKFNSKHIINIKLSLDRNEKQNPLNDILEIEKFVKFDERFLENDINDNYSIIKRKMITPNIETETFKCEYKVDVEFKFKEWHKVPKNKIEENIKLDFYYETKDKDFSMCKYLENTKNEEFDNDLDKEEEEEEERKNEEENYSDSDFEEDIIIENKRSEPINEIIGEKGKNEDNYDDNEVLSRMSTKASNNLLI